MDEKQTVMALMTSWERKGRAEGGLALIKRLLARRFGPLSPTITRQLGRLKEPQLEALADSLLDFKGLGDLRSWLTKALRPS